MFFGFSVPFKISILAEYARQRVYLNEYERNVTVYFTKLTRPDDSLILYFKSFLSNPQPLVAKIMRSNLSGALHRINVKFAVCKLSKSFAAIPAGSSTLRGGLEPRQSGDHSRNWRT